MRIGTSSYLFGSSTVLAVGSNSRHIGAIIRSGLHANRVRVAYESHSDRRRNGAIVIQFVQIDFVIKAYTAQY
jgi:hypothetical protein